MSLSPAAQGDVPSEGQEFPQLQEPPVSEVVCGFLFDSIPELDALQMGLYWQKRRKDFPRREVKPPLTDAVSFIVGGPGPLRVWLVSEDDAFVLQIQHDRFFMNWRARGSEYPRFSSRAGKEGLLSRALGEFKAFARFCSDECGATPDVKRIELAKIDQLLRPRHWSDYNDLAKLLPWFKPFASFSKSTDPSVLVQFAEKVDGGNLNVSLISANLAQNNVPIIQIDTRIVVDLSENKYSDVEKAFVSANENLNRVFFSIVSKEELSRFSKKETTR